MQLSKREQEDIVKRSKQLDNVHEESVESQASTRSGNTSSSNDKTKTKSGSTSLSNVSNNAASPRPSLLWVAQNFVSKDEWIKYYNTLESIEKSGKPLLYGHLNYLVFANNSSTFKPNGELVEEFELLMFDQNLATNQHSADQKLIALDVSSIETIKWDGDRIKYLKNAMNEWKRLHLLSNPNSTVYIRCDSNVNPHESVNTLRSVASISGSNVFTRPSQSRTRPNLPNIPTIPPIASYTAPSPWNIPDMTHQYPSSNVNTGYNNAQNARGSIQPHTTLGGRQLGQTNLTTASRRRQLTNSPPGLLQAAPNSTVNPNMYNFSTLNVHRYQSNLMTTHDEATNVRAPSSNVNTISTGRTASVSSRQNAPPAAYDHDLVSLSTKRSRSGAGYTTEVVYNGEMFETPQNLIGDVCTIYIIIFIYIYICIYILYYNNMT